MYFRVDRPTRRVLTAHRLLSSLLALWIALASPLFPSGIAQGVGLSQTSSLATASSSLVWKTQCADCPKFLLTVGHNGLQLDSHGYPHIAYVGDSVYYASNTGNGWQIESLDAGTGFVYGYNQPAPSLALDAADNPHIAYLDQTSTRLNYAVRGQNGWITSTIVTAPPGYLRNTGISLALTHSGTPLVVYNSNNHLQLARLNGKKWQVETVANDAYMTEMYVSLVLDSLDMPHISFFYFLNHFDYFLGYTVKTQSGWSSQTVDAGGQLGEWNSLALDKTGKPTITYRDATNSQVKVASWSGSQWNIRVLESNNPYWWSGSTSTRIDTLGNTQFSFVGKLGATYGILSGTAVVTQTIEPNIFGTSLQLDSGNHPHLVYFSWTDAALKYAQWVTDTWVVQTVDHTSQVGRYASLALDHNNNPHISYMDYAKGKLKYASMLDHAWRSEVVDSTGNAGGYTRLVLDGLGAPHISYYDSAGGWLKYAHLTGAGWVTQTVAAAGNTGSYTSLALDKNNNPRISYYDSAAGALKYAQWTGAQWVSQTVDNAGDVGAYSSLALDTGDKPHISYYDRTNGTLRYANWTGSGWLTQTVDTAGNVGSYTSLALDGGDNPHISYYDATNGALKYASLMNDAWLTQTVDGDHVAGFYSSLALDHAGNPHIGYYRGLIGGLRYATWNGILWLTQTIVNDYNVGSYPSLALDAAGYPAVSYANQDQGSLQYASVLEIRMYMPAIFR